MKRLFSRYISIRSSHVLTIDVHCIGTIAETSTMNVNHNCSSFLQLVIRGQQSVFMNINVQVEAVFLVEIGRVVVKVKLRVRVDGPGEPRFMGWLRGHGSREPQGKKERFERFVKGL